MSISIGDKTIKISFDVNQTSVNNAKNAIKQITDSLKDLNKEAGGATAVVGGGQQQGGAGVGGFLSRVFGRFFGGAGTDDRYSGGGNVSFFKGNRRISLVGNFNNINQQNFASQDLLGLTSSGGGGRGGGRQR